MNHTRRLRRATQFLILSLIIGGTLRADEPAAYEWKVGLAAAKITPDGPIWIAGYGGKQRSTDAASDLYAKAMAIEDQDGNKALLITTDLLWMKSHISEPLYQQITKKTGLRREQIMINSSHTHTGPAVGLEEERLGFLKAPAHIKETSQYTRKLSDRLVALSIEATKHLSAARLSWGGGAPFVMNRREFTDRGIILGVHPRGLVDRSVPVLKIASADSKLRGVLLGTACHNTSLTHRDF